MSRFNVTFFVASAVYEGLRNGKDGLPDQYARELTLEQKRRRVVLKKTNLDNQGIRTNFLKTGKCRSRPSIQVRGL